MNGRRFPSRPFWAVVTVAAWSVAVWVAVDTLRAVVPLWSPLPWFDEWATVALIGAWQAGDMSLAQVLFSQHNEHRILVPRLVFFADDLLFGGGGRLSLAAIFTVQALHAALFGAVLVRARPAAARGWAVAAVVLALMFSLRQAENFTYGFQIQFVGVFAGATLSFLLFGVAMARERRGDPSAAPLLASFAAVTLTSFTMANGLVAGALLAALALAGRMRRRVVLACVALAALLTLVYLLGYAPVAHHSRPSESLRHPLDLLLYVAAYLGSIVGAGSPGPAVTFGGLGLAATIVAAARILRRIRPCSPSCSSSSPPPPSRPRAGSTSGSVRRCRAATSRAASPSGRRSSPIGGSTPRAGHALSPPRRRRAGRWRWPGSSCAGRSSVGRAAPSRSSPRKASPRARAPTCCCSGSTIPPPSDARPGATRTCGTSCRS